MNTLNDYYLMKCFSKPEYRDDFNSGKQIYMNSTSYFWKQENTFQKDYEGIIFNSENGYLLNTNSDFINVVKTSKSFNELINNVNGCGNILSDNCSFGSWIEVFLCCFYMLPKKDVKFEKNKMIFLNEKARYDFVEFITKYLNNENVDAAYCSVYNASRLCSIFVEEFSKRGYSVSYGQVNYEDVSVEQRIKHYQDREYNKLIFSKPKSFEYQKEFRFVLGNKNNQDDEHIVEAGIDLSLSHGFDFEFVKKEIIAEHNKLFSNN